MGIGHNVKPVGPWRQAERQGEILTLPRRQPGQAQIAMGAVEVIQHHRNTHIADIELAAVVNSKHQGPFTASAANTRLPGQGLHRQITAEVGDGVEGVDHQGIQPHQGAPPVLVVQVAAVAKVQAAAVQVQVFSRYGYRQPSQLRLGIPKATAIPSRAGSEITNRRYPSRLARLAANGRWLQGSIPNPKVLEGGVNTPAIALPPPLHLPP